MDRSYLLVDQKSRFWFKVNYFIYNHFSLKQENDFKLWRMSNFIENLFNLQNWVCWCWWGEVITTQRLGEMDRWIELVRKRVLEKIRAKYQILMWSYYSPDKYVKASRDKSIRLYKLLFKIDLEFIGIIPDFL